MPAKRATPADDIESMFTRQRVVVQFDCGMRILRMIHGRDARATLSNCTITASTKLIRQFGSQMIFPRTLCS
jgi:hypothetical protein